MEGLIDNENLGLGQAELLQVKHWMTPNPHCIRIGQTLQDAGEMMNRLNVDSLPIIDEQDYLVGMITLRKLLSSILKGQDKDTIISRISNRNYVSLKRDDSIFSAAALPYSQIPVIDEEEKVIGILTVRDINDGYSRFIHMLKQKEHSADVLQIILERAYEGIVVVDKFGMIMEFNEAYSRFTGVSREDAIGRHVTEVIDNTHLHLTVKTATPERGVIQRIQCQDMVVHRIPIWDKGELVGAIGMLIFEGVTEVYKLYESLQRNYMHVERKEQPLTVKLEEDSRMTLDQIVGTSPEISEVKRLARRSARTLATVLITGESGTGKEMFAKSIHHISPFSNGRFISVNCGAIPEALFESELFGYEEGAFTGASKGGKQGKFELAHNGTVFLDEVAEMPIMMQTKLLRVLQEKEAERVGGIQKYRVNARIIAATNRNLKERVREGLFREDLFYRLNIIELFVPPLRERRQDIPILLSYYLKAVCEKYDLPKKSFSPQAIAAFIHYEWQGNIREMVNVVERLVTLVDSQTIEEHHLHRFIKEESETQPVTYQQPSLMETARDLGRQKEKELVIRALRDALGNKKKAAELLGIHRTTLYQKLKKYNIPV
ncbi:sigma 54-interacting transcriptional regulator [Cytobacillus purgationiresistens]